VLSDAPPPLLWHVREHGDRDLASRVRGNVVLTERVDTFTIGQVVAPLPVMGTFEVRDGKISAWRDSFDMAQITAMLSGDA
jgi:limonene-1,2-epoxide hydrolase